MPTEAGKYPPYKTWIALLLAVATFAVYGQVATHGFVLYDDPLYVQENPTVLAGLTPGNISWAFTTLSMANWHPLTWLSYLLDIQLFGPHPGAMLLENVAIHAVNAILLFLLLERLTGALWRSAVVAALFALHPLHVESVAWVSERKDVLSTLFWLLTLVCYARHAEQGGLRHYILSLGAFALGLLSKPMLVTLPLVMLLLDYWPLQRFGTFGGGESPGRKRVPPLRLLVEKLPFLALAAGSCAMTVIAQSGAMTPLNVSSLTDRILNSLNAYTIYLGRTFWPAGLSPFYPFPDAIPLWQPLCSLTLLAAVTALAFRERRRRPWLVVGWLWFLLSMLPVIGIVRVGMHALADRYTYVPLIGIFVMLAWGGTEIWSGRSKDRRPLVAATLLILSACSLLTGRQVAFWKDSATLFGHARDVTENNYVASNILAIDRMKRGDHEGALRLFDLSISQASWFIEPYIHKANLLKRLERNEEAIEAFNRAMVVDPFNVTTYIDLGNLLASQGRLDEAVDYLLLGLRVDPRSAAAHYNLALALHQLGRLGEAIDHYNQSLNYSPGFPDAHNNLGIALAETGRLDEAIANFREALRLKPDYEEASRNLERAMGMKK